MEFRQVVHSVCRSAAAASRPSLASTRPPQGILVQHRQFTTNNKQWLEALAMAPPQSQDPLPIRHMPSSASRQRSLPPRPAPIRKSNFFMDPETAKKARSPWTTKPAADQTHTNNGQTPPQSQAPTLRGTAPSSPLSIDDVFSIPGQIEADMEAATTGAAGNSLTNWDEDIFLKNHHYTTEPELRLRPSTGRTININKGSVDLARGFRLLQKAVNQNGIKRDMIMQRAHERPALKRKRQKRERWQQRFQSSFRATMNRVFELKAQGW